MRKLIETTAQCAICYLEGLDARNVAPTEEAICLRHATRTLISSSLMNPSPMNLSILNSSCNYKGRVGSPASMAQAGSRFFGFVTGGSLPAALAANWLAAAWDRALWTLSHHSSYSLTGTSSAALAPRRTAPPRRLRWCFRYASNRC